jgi:hypothetical protein
MLAMSEMGQSGHGALSGQVRFTPVNSTDQRNTF